MPRRSILSAAERASLFAMPEAQDDFIRHYSFGESELALIRQRRGDANRLGFAVQLAYMRYPGIMLASGEVPFSAIASAGGQPTQSVNRTLERLRTPR